MIYGSGSVLYVEERNKYRAFFNSHNKRISKYFNTKKQADEWLVKCHADTINGLLVNEAKLTLGQWSVQYIDTYAKPKVKYKTLLRYEQYAKSIEPLSHIPLSALTAFQVQKFLNTIDTDSKKNKCYKYLMQILKKATVLRLIPFNIMDAVDAPTYSPTKKEVFTDKELQRIKAELPNHPHETFILTAIATGCRIGELCGLRIQDVFDTHIHISQEVERKKSGWYIDTPKSKTSQRDIALPKMLIERLRREYRTVSTHPTEFVFHQASGEPYLPDFIQRVWRKVLYYAEVPYRNFHYLRHTHATNLLHKFDYVEVQHRLGHTNASTTLDMYGHPKAEYKPKIIKEIEKMLT